MLDTIINNDQVKELLREIFNNPKYYNKQIEEVLKNEYYLHERVLVLFYDALYKYKLIVEDEDYLKDFLNGFEALLKKLDNIEDIKYGISKLLGKLIIKKLEINKDEVEEKKEEILNYVYNKYIKEGYYIRGLNKVDYQKIKQTGIIRGLHLEYVDVLNEILEKYDYEVYDNYKEIEFNTDFGIACHKSINSPSYLFNLVVNNKYINNNREAYYLKDKRLVKRNINTLLNNLKVSQNDKKDIRELFNIIWDYFNSVDNNIYLVLIKRDKLKKVDKYKYVDEFSFEEALYNIFTTYDDFEDRDYVDSEIDYLIELPTYKRFVKVNDVDNSKKIVIDNEYGMTSIFMIIGICLILLGVLLSIVLV